MIIRSLERNDYEAWLPLWQASCEQKISEDITAETWHRLMDDNEKIYGLGIFHDQTLLGILHYILHPNTGFKEDCCFMQDIYVHENCRQMGLAKSLILELQAIGKREKWVWIYWFADNDDIAVQNLYKNLGIKMNFGLHMLPTQE